MVVEVVGRNQLHNVMKQGMQQADAAMQQKMQQSNSNSSVVWICTLDINESKLGHNHK